jgi:hypothetical protein
LNNLFRIASQARFPVALLLVAAACGDVQPTGPSAGEPLAALQAFDCTASVASASVSCSSPLPAGPNLAIVGSQNDYVRLTSSNVTAVGGLFEFEVTVQNLLYEAMGTPDGVTPDTAGISVFFLRNPVVTAGTGTVTVTNADDTKEFTAPSQPYFRYNEVLSQDEVSSSKPWQLAYDPGVQTFTFRVYVAAELQALLVINEVLANPRSGALPPGTTGITDANGEWFEVYNRGRLPVQMQGMTISDSSSAVAGKQGYHVIASSLLVQPGEYVILGNNANTSTNGGVPVDYAYGNTALVLNNAVDAIKLSRSLTPGDTLALFTVDRVQYADATKSALDGISRELLNPALDNANMDGTFWESALGAATYGSPPAPPTRGTPKAQNSVYTP